MVLKGTLDIRNWIGGYTEIKAHISAAPFVSELRFELSNLSREEQDRSLTTNERETIPFSFSVFDPILLCMRVTWEQ